MISAESLYIDYGIYSSLILNISYTIFYLSVSNPIARIT